MIFESVLKSEELTGRHMRTREPLVKIGLAVIGVVVDGLCVAVTEAVVVGVGDDGEALHTIIHFAQSFSHLTTYWNGNVF